MTDKQMEKPIKEIESTVAWLNWYSSWCQDNQLWAESRRAKQVAEWLGKFTLIGGE